MGGDFELRHWRPQLRPRSLSIPDSIRLDPLAAPSPPSAYTSLSELIRSPAVDGAVSSPSAVEIRIRNRLVQQAAHAYLQPTPSSTEVSRRRRRRFSVRRARRLFESCFGFVGGFVRGFGTRR